MPKQTVLAVVSCLFASILPAQEPSVDAAVNAIDTALADVHRAMERSRWSDARQALLALVAAHDSGSPAQKAILQAQRDALVFDLQTCCFYEQAKVPEPKDLLAGKIVNYDQRTGRIKLEYKEHMVDWEGEGDLHVHPLVFAGNYTLTLTGTYPFGDESLRLVFDISDDAYYLADFGYMEQNVYVPASLSVGGEDEPRVLEKTRSNAKKGRPYTAALKVTEDRVEMVFDRKTVLKIKRPGAELGQIGLFPTQVGTAVLEGKVEPAWFQGRIDEEIAKQREAFDKDWRADRLLPKWLFERPQLTRTAARHNSWLPGLERRVSPALERVLELLHADNLAGARAALDACTEPDITPLTRSYLQATLLLREGQPEQALALLEPLVATTPSTPLLLLSARALEDTGQLPQSLERLLRAATEDPGEPSVYEALCTAHLRSGRIDDARRLLRDGKMRHGLWDELAALEQMLAMVQRGPAWPRRFSYTSTHYEVFSDIDRKVCMNACMLLEQSYVNLMAQMSWIKEDKSQPRFRVFLFSGEAGYQEYCKAIIGSAVPHTAGLYSPVLKQLLIWNVPKREDMERTIRHEGFHQFLDRLMDNAPVWLNEGTAEFWETAQRTAGRIEGGQVRRDHIATLFRSRDALPKLEQFVFGARDDFYANAQLRYPQAWALVHFLRKGPRVQTERFTTLWNALREGGSRRAAIEKAFANVDWPAFEQGFWDHLRELK